MQFCKEEFEKEERNLFYYDSIMECLQKKTILPAFEEIVSANASKLNLYQWQQESWGS